MKRDKSRQHLNLTPIAAGILLLCNGTLWAANTITVQNCNDSGTGSLRAAVANANSGDTIDLSTLSCAKITLTTGAIPIAQTNLILNGPGASQLSIDGDFFPALHYNRIFAHYGTGTLRVNQVTLMNARYKGATTAAGGCVFSAGSVALNQTTVTGCVALEKGAGAVAQGGGVFAEKGATVVDSTITGNVAWAGNSSGQTVGGGIAVYGGLTVKYSTISENAAFDGTQNRAGGIYTSNGNLFMVGSTVSGNSATFAGGMQVNDYTGPHSIEIINSTISGNFAHWNAGLVATAPMTLANSTIAFNHTSGAYSGAGFEFLNTHGTSLTLQSTIIANNYNDGGIDADASIDGNVVITGGNNLVTSHVGPLPADTLTACPRIGPLGNHGGGTQIHPLLKSSPAIDAGNNVTSGLTYDQRGTGFPRTHGAGTDIGAFEDEGAMQDMIFESHFEGRCR